METKTERLLGAEKEIARFLSYGCTAGTFYDKDSGQNIEWSVN